MDLETIMKNPSLCPSLGKSSKNFLMKIYTERRHGYPGILTLYAMPCMCYSSVLLLHFKKRTENFPNIWGHAQIFSHIWGSRQLYITLQLLPSEFSYIWRKFYFIFYQCGVDRNFSWAAPTRVARALASFHHRTNLGLSWAIGMTPIRANRLAFGLCVYVCFNYIIIF
jgi:hypothetical protein